MQNNTLALLLPALALGACAQPAADGGAAADSTPTAPAQELAPIVAAPAAAPATASQSVVIAVTGMR
ncbi:MAG: hypothetical protein QGH51_10075 [Planctomycetota bacterium]|jgi:hypothetical protein|nr:hypothetical protein [Planctomycetota bacterium]MDP6942357.1 hypothetical protein [Planctomycetota bacterium]